MIESYVHPFWLTNEASRYFTPQDDRYPEGKAALMAMLGNVCRGDTVTDFGCGDGRLAEAFHPDKYIGYDPNPTHVAKARVNFPKHKFVDDWLAFSKVIVAWNVLMHVRDEHLLDVMQLLASRADKIVIGEMMDRKWRRPAEPAPAFNRDPQEYDDALYALGYRGVRHKRELLRIKRYDDVCTVLQFEIEKPCEVH